MNTTTTETKTETTAAKEIRKALKVAFPGTKFSVTKSSHSCVDVRWTDGPAYQAVDEIAGKFQAGHFDGMTDSYVYDRSAPKCSVRFVSCSREISKETREKAIADLTAIFSAPKYTIEDNVYRMLNRADLRKPYAGIKFVGGVESFEIVTE